MKRFQPRALSLAIASAFGAGLVAAPSAFALDPTRTAAANLIYVAGATAPTKAIWKSFRAFCKISVADPFNVYKAGTNAALFDPGDSGFGNSFAYSCKFKSAGDPAPVPVSFAGLDVTFLAGVTDGSFSSIRGQTTVIAQQQTHVNIANLVAGCGATGTTALNSDGDLTTGNCTTVQAGSMGGFSDVEVALFQDLLPFVAGNVTAADIKPAVVTTAGQVFGIAVSESLYRALQVAQSLPAGCQDDGAFTAPLVVGLDDKSAACQPSITSTEYSSIVNGVKGALPKSVGWGFMAPALNNTNVTLCRRVEVSGTQASSNAFFLGRPCLRGPVTGGERTVAGLATAGNSNLGTRLFISTNSGSSNARTCLNSVTPANGVTAGGVAATDYRIGILSAENTPDPTDKFTFIKLDGVAVNEDAFNRQTTIDGKYSFAYELALHTNVSTLITPVAVESLLVQIGADLGNPNTSNLRGVYARRGGAFAQTSFPTQIGKGLRALTATPASCSPFTF